MTRRFIRLSDGRRMPLARYVQIVKAAKANPDREFSRSFCGWWPATGAEILRQFHAGMVERINAAVPYVQRGQA